MDEEKLNSVFDLIELFHQLQGLRANKDFLKATQGEKNFSGTMNFISVGSEIHVQEIQFKRMQEEAERQLNFYSRQKRINPPRVNHTFDGIKYIAYLTPEDQIEIRRE